MLFHKIMFLKWYNRIIVTIIFFMPKIDFWAFWDPEKALNCFFVRNDFFDMSVFYRVITAEC